MQQTLLHDVACLHQKLPKKPWWNVGAHADLFCQHAVLFSALYQCRECVRRELRMMIISDRTCNIAIAAFHKISESASADPQPSGHREQMRLAFVLGDVHQIVIVDPCLLENGTCDLDVVILGERADNTGRRIRNRRNAAGEFGERFCFDLLDQAADDVIEQRDVFGVEARTPSRNKVVMRRSVSARFSAEPCWTTSSSSGSSDAGTPIQNLQNAEKTGRAGGFTQI